MYETIIKGSFDHFMNLEELQRLVTLEKVQVGSHSHFHDVILTRKHSKKKKPLSPWKLEYFQNHPAIAEMGLSVRSRLAFQGYALRKGKVIRRTEKEWEDYIKYDTEQCLKWFDSHLNLKPEMYCLPFNEYSDKMLSILRSFGFKKFYGARAVEGKNICRRTDIDSLTKHIDGKPG